MKITILGTGNALVTEIFNTCFTISDGGRHFLIDCGGGNRILKVLKDNGIALSDIHDIFLTHNHLDHLSGVPWMLRMIATAMLNGSYDGDLTLYGHDECIEAVRLISKYTLTRKIQALFDERIHFDTLESGDKRSVIGCETEFFDIYSTKAKQFAMSLTMPDGRKFVYAGDEPLGEENMFYAEGADWLMHEAFCLDNEADVFKPYPKSHGTVKDAAEKAERCGVKNLILIHTEESHGKERKALYSAEAKRYYTGRLFVPDDYEVITLE